MRPTTSGYWNPILETLNPAATRALQLGKFQRVVAWVYERGPMYRRKYAAACLTPGDIRSWEDVARVPLITKDDYRCPGVDPFPCGDTLCVPLRVQPLRRLPVRGGARGPGAEHQGRSASRSAKPRSRI